MDFFALPKSKPIRSFSTGQQNQFEVILALCQGADYILMDEPFAGNDVFNREDFYKVLLGILEPNETIVLSTHLIEEVSGFLGRAVLLHKGQIVGDAQLSDLEEQGQTLMDYDQVDAIITSLTASAVPSPTSRGRRTPMRKYPILLFALVLLLGVSAVFAARAMDAPKDQVAFTERVIYGDPQPPTA